MQARLVLEGSEQRRGMAEGTTRWDREGCLGFERITWKGHGLLYPWFSFLPMSSHNEVFSCIFLAFIGCFFSSSRRVILLFIFFGLSTVFSLSIGVGYAIWVSSRLSLHYG